MSTLVLLAGIDMNPKDEHAAQVTVVELCDYDVEKAKEILEMLGLDRRVVEDDGESE